MWWRLGNSTDQLVLAWPVVNIRKAEGRRRKESWCYEWVLVNEISSIGSIIFWYCVVVWQSDGMPENSIVCTEHYTDDERNVSECTAAFRKTCKPRVVTRMNACKSKIGETIITYNSRTVFCEVLQLYRNNCEKSSPLRLQYWEIIGPLVSFKINNRNGKLLNVSHI
jgi:hypothetical protein